MKMKYLTARIAYFFIFRILAGQIYGFLFDIFTYLCGLCDRHKLSFAESNVSQLRKLKKLTAMEEDQNKIDLYEEEPSSEEGSSNLKKIMYALIAVIVVLLVVLVFVWIQRSALVKDLNAEKDDLTAQLVELQSDYEGLYSDYETINMQLDSSREEVAQLIERIKTTEATNRTKIRQYEKELGTLRSVMKGYIYQIDSLNTLNQKLTADAAAARREAAESKRKSEELSKTVESLSDKVASGSIIKGRGLRIDAYNGSDKITDRSSRVVRLLTTLSLVENELAPRGPVRVYIQVKDPDGVLLTNSSSREFTLNGTPMIASASREVDYQGTEVELSIYLNDIDEYVKGIYTVEAFTEKGSLGTAELLLR